MRELPQNIKDHIASGASFIYCFHIKLQNNVELFLTEYDQNIHVDNMIFAPNTGLSIKHAEFNDSAQNHIILRGIFEEGGISKNDNLVDAEVVIYIYASNYLYHFVTYYCSSHICYDLNFEIQLLPISRRYNHALLKIFSKTCRANLADTECSMLKENFSQIYDIYEIIGNVIIIQNLEKEVGYFDNGEAIFGKNELVLKILHQSNNSITLAAAVPDEIKHLTQVKIIAGCDKNFQTCCEKFDNAINFRGEPFVPDNNYLDLLMVKSRIDNK